jgi:hypothetical protein
VDRRLPLPLDPMRRVQGAQWCQGDGAGGRDATAAISCKIKSSQLCQMGSVGRCICRFFCARANAAVRLIRGVHRKQSKQNSSDTYININITIKIHTNPSVVLYTLRMHSGGCVVFVWGVCSLDRLVGVPCDGASSALAKSSRSRGLELVVALGLVFVLASASGSVFVEMIAGPREIQPHFAHRKLEQ